MKRNWKRKKLFWWQKKASPLVYWSPSWLAWRQASCMPGTWSGGVISRLLSSAKVASSCRITTVTPPGVSFTLWTMRRVTCDWYSRNSALSLNLNSSYHTVRCSPQHLFTIPAIRYIGMMSALLIFGAHPEDKWRSSTQRIIDVPKLRW